MKIERTKNAARNIVFGGILKAYQILVPFLMRTVMIYFMGIQYLGLNSLFSSILQVLNLAELGIGSAMVYSMYQPIAEDDEVTICALMNLYKIYYRVIGLVVAIGGLMILPFLPNLIKMDTVPKELNVYVLYLLNLAATVLSYWLFAYKNSLLTAHQRIDVISKVTLITNTIQYILQLIVIIFLHNYYYYYIVILATQICTNIITALVVNRMYPDYQPRGKLDKSKVKEINARVRDLFTAKLGGVIVNSADTIVISAFLGLTVLAIYQNYYFIMTAVIGIIYVIFNACTAGIGNSIIVETKEKNFADLQKFTFLIVWISGVSCCFFLCLYQPFMELWVGKENMLQFSAVVCLVVYFFVYEMNQLLNLYKDAAGIWHEDRFRPLVTAGGNLIMNLIMVQVWGIYGVLLSTVLSTCFIGMPWLLHNLFTVLFEPRFMKGYLKQLFGYIVGTCFICMIVCIPCNLLQFPNYVLIIVRGIICATVPNLLFILLYRKKKEFADSIILMDRITKGKLKLYKWIGN